MPEQPIAASLGNRILAFAYDYLIIFGYLVVLSVATILLMRSADFVVWNEFFRNPVRIDLIAFMTTIFPVSVYFAWQESSARQASWGKSKRGLIVESKQGQRISFFLALGRSLCKLIPWQIAHTSLFNIPGWPTNPSAPPSWVMLGLSLVWIIVGAYALSILISEEKLALYDRLLGIRVVSS